MWTSARSQGAFVFLEGGWKSGERSLGTRVRHDTQPTSNQVLQIIFLLPSKKYNIVSIIKQNPLMVKANSK